MALLRWIHLRKLVPIEDLIAGAVGAAPARGRCRAPAAAAPACPSTAAGVAAERRTARGSRQLRRRRASSTPAPRDRRTGAAVRAAGETPRRRRAGTSRTRCSPRSEASKAVFYNTVVAQAQTIEVAADRVSFTFSPAQRTLRDMFEQNRGWLEGARAAGGRPEGDGRRARSSDGVAGRRALEPAADGGVSRGRPADRKTALKEQALADAGVQALLEVFPAEIRDVEEM